MNSSAVRPLARRPDAAADARRHVRELCQDHDVALGHDVELVVSELVSNAVVHGVGRITLDVRPVPGGIRVSVADEGPGEPTVEVPTPDRGSGRGLYLVDRLSADWGVLRLPGGGKEVWCVLMVIPVTVPAEPAADEAAASA